MPVKEIAEHLNISSKTVENQINKALKQLRVATKTFLHFFL
jgi:RNA polymerase sigma-70 factor (ECF subfamily)